MFPCQEHLPEEGPCSTSQDSFTSLVSISLQDIIHSITEGWVEGSSTPVFLSRHSLEGLPTKAKVDPSPHEMRLCRAGHQPSISWSQVLLLVLLLSLLFIIIIIIIIIIIYY